ncbi:hypothetical protein H9636_14570 [Ureibacillus sp. Re31]|uniref:Uncharacterized protein n=1 Tax=Ureibacillus galli TaxID=2762222 RepID=A0ABR8XF73_9BACL|nr:hypothetical protein [Ureibacillus galli]MBD8027873.1 hypothetical protein [Ureibacillus galli]
MDNKINNIESTVIDLLSILKRYNNGQISYQIALLEDILNIIKSNSDNELKENRINSLVEDLYPIRGGLTDFYIWKEDTKERIMINKPISELNDKLWNLLKN